MYKVSDIFETVYFSDGVPELSGYTLEEYQELVKGDAAAMIYREDTEKVVSKIREAIEQHTVADLEFRKQHRDGHIVWVHVQARQVGEEEGFPLVQCVFHNITELKDAQFEMEHLLNSIPGGIASYRVDGQRLTLTFCSDGLTALSGYSREELPEIGVFNAVYEPDQKRVHAALKYALESGSVLDVSCRIYHKSGRLIWIHVNGRRMGPLTENARFYVVMTGMSAETHLFQSLINDSEDGIYVIDKENYDLLYVNESEKFFTDGCQCLGKKCYEALHGKDAPCEFCTLHTHKPDGQEHEMNVDGTDRIYTTHFREIDWNGVPAYVKYVRDVTQETSMRRERDRLEQYFQTVMQNLPGGIVVIKREPGGHMVPEYLSQGFADLTGMTLEEAWDLYRMDASCGVHPDDWEQLKKKLEQCIADGTERFVMEYRLQKGQDDYVWVRPSFSLIREENGCIRVYAVFHDMTREIEDQNRVRRQYNELLFRHYQKPGPNALVVGHCNITQNRILEIIDHTEIGLLKTFGPVREEFFRGMSGLIVDQKDRQVFLNTYLSKPALAAFARNETEQVQECFIKLPYEEVGRYVQIKMSMVETPGSGDVTGILTVTDITEQVVSDKVLHQLSVTGSDFVVVVDILKDCYQVLSVHENATDIPPLQGCHSKWMEYMLKEKIVPRDKEAYRINLAAENLAKRLKSEGAYSFAFSIQDEHGDIRTKNMTVSEVDLRLGRVCLSRMDITDSVREQQGLLNMIAYTFDLAGFISIQSKSFTMYTRRTVLENLAPYVVENYERSLERMVAAYGFNKDHEGIEKEFVLENMLERLEKTPNGYDFVLPYQDKDGLHYKQINVLWGDQNRRTICLVRMDVTDMLAAERETKKALEEALALAEKANQAKSDFLSAMSHDIRTPLNAIMGMTTLAAAHGDDRERVADCLKKILASSRHLLSLVNDILDMNKLERSGIKLERMVVCLPELLEQLSSMMIPQAKVSGLQLSVRTDGIVHRCFYGDMLRINQILINILGNAVKFTPEGGKVDFLTQEIAPERAGNVRYRFTVSDTGIGMSGEFLTHLFEPFTRSRNVTQIEGTGLGLSIVKGLVDLLGGRITVDSVLGEGTTFIIELEEEPAEETGSSRQGESGDLVQKPVLAGRHVLVVEDNAINAEITCGLLELFGADTVVKTDGMQAVQEFENAKPGTYDIILMDIQMPVMNGYEAARAIRRSTKEDAARIPIIAMTANAFMEDIRSAIDAGMNAHVSKPIDVEVLRTVLVDALSGEKG